MTKKDSDRRKYKRIFFESLPVEIHFQNNPNIELSGEGKNVSTSGACVLIKKSNKTGILSKNNPVKAVFNIPFSMSEVVPFRTLSGKAAIVRVKKLVIDNTDYIEIGLSFLEALTINSPADL